MNRTCNLGATLLVSATLLSGCDWISDIDVVGSLEPLTQQQIDVLGFGSPGASAIVSSSQLSLSVTADCSDPNPQPILQRQASGTLALDNEQFQIFATSCDGDSVALPEGSELLTTGAIYAAYQESVGVGTGQPVFTIQYMEFMENTGEIVPGTEALAGETLIYIAPADLSFNSPTPDTVVLIGSIGPSGLAGQQILVKAAEDLQTLIDSSTGFGTRRFLGRAASRLTAAADDRFWESDTMLNVNNGLQVYRRVATAINSIELVADTTNQGALMMALDDISSALLDLMRNLAETQISAAESAGGSAFLISRATRRLESGDISRSQDRLRETTQRYGRAWSRAGRAL